MSKIKSKDLNYDKTLPPFLQRLHDQKAGRADTDRHEQPIARARRAKDPNDDDGPTMVDESGETVSREEYEKLNKVTSEGAQDTKSIKDVLDPASSPKMSGALPESAAVRAESKVTDGTAQKKRKAGKAIVAQDAEDKDKDPADSKVAKKAKKKAKPVKLAFDDEGD